MLPIPAFCDKGPEDYITSIVLPECLHKKTEVKNVVNTSILVLRWKHRVQYMFLAAKMEVFSTMLCIII